jgi:hypothetical protein
MVKRTQPDSRPNGQDDRPMVNQEIGRWGKREGGDQRTTPKKYARWKVRWRRVSPRLAIGQESVFGRS